MGCSEWGLGLGSSTRRYYLPCGVKRVSRSFDNAEYISTASGNMILIEHSTDFELYSSTSKGAIQGYGYTFHSCKFSHF
jgi:hypothetical protein